MREAKELLRKKADDRFRVLEELMMSDSRFVRTETHVLNGRLSCWRVVEKVDGPARPQTSKAGTKWRSNLPRT